MIRILIGFFIIGIASLLIASFMMTQMLIGFALMLLALRIILSHHDKVV